MKNYITPSLSTLEESITETITANSGFQILGSVCNKCGCCSTYSQFIIKHCNYCTHGPIERCQQIKYYTFTQ